LEPEYEEDTDVHIEDLTENPELELEEDEIEKEKEEEEEQEGEIEAEPFIATADSLPEQTISEAPVSEKIHAGAPVQKPIAHLIGAEKDDNNSATSEKKSKLWPYFVVLGF